MTFFRGFPVIFFSLVLVAVTACAGSVPAEKVTSSSVQTEVLSFRWQKKLFSNVPNFNVPGFYEENDRFYPVETSAAGFDTDAKRIFVGAAVGGLYCIEASTGKTVWRYTMDAPVGSTPLYDSERKRVIFGADDGNLYALHSRSGRLLFKLDTGAEIRRSIWLKDDTIFFANADNTVFAVDPLTFEVIWRFRRPPVEGFCASGYGDIRFYKEMILAGFSDGILVSLDAATGVVNWTADLAAEAVASAPDNEIRLSDVDATPVVINDTVIAASVTGGVYGLDVENGNVLWTRTDLDMVTGMTSAYDEAILVRAGGRGMVVLNPETGRTRLQSSFGLGLKSDPVLFDDVLLISDTEAGLYAVSVGTGKVLQKLDMTGGFFSRPSEYGGYMFILGNWSTIYAFSIR